MKKILTLIVVALFLSCGNSENKEDDYGYVETNPILVGGDNLENGPERETQYLENLTGPNGELVYFDRTGICCEFDSEKSTIGKGVLDIYDVTYDGLEEPIELYFNMYETDPDPVRAPKGFQLKE